MNFRPFALDAPGHLSETHSAGRSELTPSRESRIRSMKRRRASSVRRLPPRTHSLGLREMIEDEIATGVLMPGTRLDETELAERFGVSRTPVREALIQLASTGILQMRPRRGMIVPELAPHRLVEMFEVMANLEAMCGRLAARRMVTSEHRELLRVHEECEKALRSKNSDAYYHQNEIFHHLIYRGSHNTFLAEQASTLHKRLHPYRRLQLRVRDRMHVSFTEHRQILDAILAGDSETAEVSLRKHVLIQGEKFGDLVASLRLSSEGAPSAHAPEGR